MYELIQTPQYRKDVMELEPNLRHLLQEYLETLRESPTNYKNLVHQLSKRPKEVYYRLRLPGAYLYYLIPTDSAQVVLTHIQCLRKHGRKQKAQSVSFY